MRSKKGAVELSMSMLVIIILSMVILAGGIGLLFKFIDKAETIKGDLDAQTKEEIDRAATDGGQQVALPRNRVTLQRGDSHIFGVGVLNTRPREGSFTIQVEFDSLIGTDNRVIEVLEPDKLKIKQEWLLYYPDAFHLLQGEHSAQKIQVTVPNYAQEGTYIFNVRVYVNNGQYGNTQKMYVKAT